MRATQRLMSHPSAIPTHLLFHWQLTRVLVCWPPLITIIWSELLLLPWPGPTFIHPGLWLLLLLSCLPWRGWWVWHSMAAQCTGRVLFVFTLSLSLYVHPDSVQYYYYSVQYALCAAGCSSPFLTWQVIYALEAESSGDTLQRYWNTLGRNSIIQYLDYVS